MFAFVKKCFFIAMIFFGCNVLDVNPLRCVSMNNQECKISTKIIDTNKNEPLLYPYIIKVNKCSGSCNNINNLYSKLCVPNVVKNTNFKVWNLMSRNNETRHIKWLETCKCKYRLDASVCNNKQRWNNKICSCECKELIDSSLEYVIKDLFEILVIVNVNVINHVTYNNI